MLPLENSLFWWFVCEALFPVCVTLLSLAAWKLHLQTLMEHWDLHWKTTGSVSFSKFTPDFLTTDQSVQKSTNCRLSQTDKLPKFFQFKTSRLPSQWIKSRILKLISIIYLKIPLIIKSSCEKSALNFWEENPLSHPKLKLFSKMIIAKATLEWSSWWKTTHNKCG